MRELEEKHAAEIGVSTEKKWSSYNKINHFLDDGERNFSNKKVKNLLCFSNKVVGCKV